ncbi:spore cortex-lytic enzyme [Salinithrix halophila]|uniref:Spore cortex-lytic enzyme n=1 Tax=Salinithrix halophila TaxID=1485204 RepID=A0ABV8JEW4_9BACL
MKKQVLALSAAFAVAAIGSVLPFGSQQAEAAAPTQIHYGSQNGDVWDLQNRLIKLGYQIKLDGIYGLETEKAVIQYQKANDLRIDGISGPQTWSQLKKATGKAKPAKSGASKKASVSQQDVNWIARAVHGEARGESFKGKVAVASVILNRMESSKYPNTAKGVIMEKGAFTAVDDGQIWLNPKSESYKAAKAAVKGWDPSQGAMFYFNPDTATSKWIWTRPQITKIGNHIFTN